MNATPNFMNSLSPEEATEAVFALLDVMAETFVADEWEDVLAGGVEAYATAHVKSFRRSLESQGITPSDVTEGAQRFGIAIRRECMARMSFETAKGGEA
ncbi:hypothetical protein ACP4J4_20300 (plasmid) [Aureimonas ureilytica]|uniref:hypothetical protein n=1 Tax=Aureimonas ureilytica TaxID=401562 RepID=UPI003CE93197